MTNPPKNLTTIQMAQIWAVSHVVIEVVFLFVIWSFVVWVVISSGFLIWFFI
jgi:hypothetical protein